MPRVVNVYFDQTRYTTNQTLVRHAYDFISQTHFKYKINMVDFYFTINSYSDKRNNDLVNESYKSIFQQYEQIIQTYILYIINRNKRPSIVV